MPVHEYNPRRFIAGLVFLAIGLSFFLEALGIWTVNLVIIWPLLFIGLGASVLLGRSRQAKVEEDRSAQLAVAEERVRIARELHDVVAHGVSLMTVQIAAARRVAKKKPADAETALATAEETGRQSLAELRGIVSVLRGADASIEAASTREAQHRAAPHDPAPALTPMPDLDDIPVLIESVREAGLDVSYSVLGVRPELPATTGLVVYRVVQEALTNVIRHADAKRVEVSLMYLPDSIDIRIEDDGRGAKDATARTDGHGILGMRERLATVGGAVTAGPGPEGRGWQVHAEIPLLTAALIS
ncbi:MAG: sensor histidine kinase [Actinobacteria bacterium]|nr:sensor histidine kinase [Actinomycetota bacterium]